MLANFKLSGNVPASIDLFKNYCNILAVASELILSIFGGIPSLVYDLLGLMSLISFTTSLKANSSNENFDFILIIYFLIDKDNTRMIFIHFYGSVNLIINILKVLIDDARIFINI